MEKTKEGTRRQALIPAELEVLGTHRDLAGRNRGCSISAVAARLGVSEEVVDRLTASVLHKLGARSMYDAMLLQYGKQWRGTPGAPWRLSAEWLGLLARFQNACAYCGSADVELHRDHCIPVAAGGSEDWTNIVPCCARCNGRKGRLTPAQFKAREASREHIAKRLLRAGYSFDEVTRFFTSEISTRLTSEISTPASR